MEAHFQDVQHFEGDVYVADYTHYVQDHPEMNAAGVVISADKPDAIESLKFCNPNKVKVLAVNFEKNEAFFKPDGRNKVANCECMLVAEQGTGKRWLALAELKYCKGEDRSITRNFEDALIQLRDTFIYLRDSRHLFTVDSFRFYWIISIPEHSEKIPFSEFALSQDQLLEYKANYNSIIISDNVVNIWTGTVIRQPEYE
ncbi:MAG: hypothetical protein J6I36_09440 [Bacteroidaceae bacterium]|nr:hypothetical protein [Bacteroidaceae bacterium]